MIKVDFQDGFYHDVVVITVNGKEVVKQTDVTTRFQTGFASSIDLEIPENSSLIEVVLPLKHVSHRIEVKPGETPYLGLSISHDGRIEHRVSEEPFGYV